MNKVCYGTKRQHKHMGTIPATIFFTKQLPLQRDQKTERCEKSGRRAKEPVILKQISYQKQKERQLLKGRDFLSPRNYQQVIILTLRKIKKKKKTLFTRKAPQVSSPGLDQREEISPFIRHTEAWGKDREVERERRERESERSDPLNQGENQQFTTKQQEQSNNS